MMSGNDWWNRNVFSCRRKEETDGACRLHVAWQSVPELLTDGTAARAAAAWTTTADGDDLAGLIPERADSDTVAPYRSTSDQNGRISVTQAVPQYRLCCRCEVFYAVTLEIKSCISSSDYETVRTVIWCQWSFSIKQDLMTQPICIEMGQVGPYNSSI